MILESKHYKAAFLLVAGRPIAQVAKEVKVSQGTITQWKNDPDFSLHLDSLYSRIYTNAINELASLSMQAVDELKRIIACPNEPTKYKLQAINLILSYGGKSREYIIEQRMKNLEDLFLNEYPQPSVDNELPENRK